MSAAAAPPRGESGLDDDELLTIATGHRANDALEPALDALRSGADIGRAAREARQGAERTAALTRARAGRSSYLNAASLEGVMDPGAAAVALIFEALAQSEASPR